MRCAERKGGGKAAGYPRPPPFGDIAPYKIIGNLVLDRVFSYQSPDRTAPDDFGVLLTSQNIEAHLAHIRVARDTISPHLSAVTLGEIQIGIEMTREQDTYKAAEIEAWADQVAASYDVPTMDATTFRVWARLMRR